MFVQEENLCVCNKQKVSAMPCNEHINCSDCPSCGGDMFYYLRFLEGYSYQQYHFKQNSILFLLQGEIRIDGLHFPHLIIHNKQLLVIPPFSYLFHDVLFYFICVLSVLVVLIHS